MLPVIKILILVMTVLVLQNSVLAHVDHPTKDSAEIGLTPKLGEAIPLESTFNDERGDPVLLADLIQTPTILALVYYHCPNVCSLLLQNLAGVLNKLPAEPGKEYTALSISFDEMETPSLALQRKEVYLKMIERPFPIDAWRFLTGDKESIQKLTEAVGFHFKRVGEDFEHPVALIILAPDGKIIRYMYGTDLLPLDLKLALVEASQGRIGPAISKVVRFCFSYDPKGRKLVFNTLKVTGTITLLFALCFVAFLLFKGRKQHPKEELQE
jgi:protein SCO1